jgi:hypothetical protein
MELMDELMRQKPEKPDGARVFGTSRFPEIDFGIDFGADLKR